MKFKTIMLLMFAGLAVSSCAPSPKRAATKFMDNLKDKKFVAAAECCGVSKDKASLDLMTAMLEEGYGMQDNTVRAFVVTGDSIFPDRQGAVVTMNILYTDMHREDSVVLKLRTMNGRWIVQPFQ